MKFFINDIVDNTSTNTDGYKLYNYLEKYIVNNSPIILSFKNSNQFSTSFLNSSIGELIEKYGFDKFKKLVRIVELTPFQANVFKKYLASFGIHI